MATVDTKNFHMEVVGGMWIFAKASTIYAENDARKEAWNRFAAQAKWVQARFGLSDEQFAVELKEAAARLYANELKNEIFGYGAEKVVA